jgi:hypothetical protein
MGADSMSPLLLKRAATSARSPAHQFRRSPYISQSKGVTCDVVCFSYRYAFVGLYDGVGLLLRRMPRDT